MMIVARIVRSGILMVVIPTLLGCGSPPVGRVGFVDRSVTGPGLVVPGSLGPDFLFRSEDGDLKRFSELPGDVKIIVFSDGPQWPDCQRCQETESLVGRYSTLQATVLVVSVFAPRESCSESVTAFKNCGVEGPAQLLAVCDEQGYLRRLFGPEAEGSFFVIGADRRVVQTGQLDDAGTLEMTIRDAVNQYQVSHARMHQSADLDRPY